MNEEDHVARLAAASEAYRTLPTPNRLLELRQAIGRMAQYLKRQDWPLEAVIIRIKATVNDNQRGQDFAVQIVSDRLVLDTIGCYYSEPDAPEMASVRRS